jgi:hypothetical protein
VLRDVRMLTILMGKAMLLFAGYHEHRGQWRRPLCQAEKGPFEQRAPART